MDTDFWENARRFLPDTKAIAYAIVAFLGTQIWAAIRNRRIAIAWTATFQRLTPYATTPQFSGLLSVLWNGTPCPNLWSCEVVLRNESNRDLDASDVLFTFNDSFIVIKDQSGIRTSAKTLRWSAEFDGLSAKLGAMPEPDRPKHQSWAYAVRNREYHLPALDRGAEAVFTFWIHGADQNCNPSVKVSSEKGGLRLISRKADHRALDVAEIRRGLVVGVLLTVPVVWGLSHSDMSPLTIGWSTFVTGVCVGAIGIVGLKLFRSMLRYI
jgi:hypothetical protein